MPDPIITTTRLQLREMTDADAPFILKLVNEPGWLLYIGDRSIHSTDDALAYIRNGPQQSYADHGFGLYLAEVRDGPPIGICGLLQRTTLEHPDLGFAITEHAAGNGYATEAGRAVLEHAWHTLRLPAVLAITSMDNDLSQRVLSKLGFDRTDVRTLEPADGAVQVFSTRRPTQPAADESSGAITFRPSTPDDATIIFDIWKRSVEATHAFLDPADFTAMCDLVHDQYIPKASLLLATRNFSRIVGFMGMTGNTIDSLFVDPDTFGQGIGRAFIEHAQKLHANEPILLDVNEQNHSARRFYQRMGFTITSRSETDDHGRPYPILLMTNGR